jgi:hypothetical protein
MDPYRPDAWHDFFVASAGAAAALTGLLFVGLSLHIRFVASSALHRNTARGSLVGLVLVLVVSLVLLIRQPEAWAGAEMVFLGLFYIVVNGGYQLATYRRAKRAIPRATLVRAGLGYMLAAIGLVGGISLIAGSGPGLYLIAIQVIAIVVWNLRNAWFLLLGVADEDIARQAHREG